MKTLKTELKDFGRTAVCELKSVWKRKCCFLFQTHQNEVINCETTEGEAKKKFIWTVGASCWCRGGAISKTWMPLIDKPSLSIHLVQALVPPSHLLKLYSLWSPAVGPKMASWCMFDHPGKESLPGWSRSCCLENFKPNLTTNMHRS